MQQFLEYFSIIAFAVVFYATKDVFLATGVLIGLICLQVAFIKLTGRPMSNELKIIFWVSLVLGGITLLLRDETFIQWKTSVVNWVFALGLIGAQVFARISLLEKVLGKALALDDSIWRTLTYGWAAGFATTGFINLYVIYNYSMEAWVTFKLFGPMALSFLYVLIMVAYLISIGALKDADANAEESNPDPAKSAAHNETKQ